MVLRQIVFMEPEVHSSIQPYLAIVSPVSQPDPIANLHLAMNSGLVGQGLDNTVVNPEAFLNHVHTPYFSCPPGRTKKKKSLESVQFQGENGI